MEPRQGGRDDRPTRSTRTWHPLRPQPTTLSARPQVRPLRLAPDEVPRRDAARRRRGHERAGPHRPAPPARGHHPRGPARAATPWRGTSPRSPPGRSSSTTTRSSSRTSCALATESDVAYAMILDRDGRVAAHDHRPEIVGTILSGTVPSTASCRRTRPVAQEIDGPDGESLYDFAVPIRVDAQRVGHGPRRPLAPADGRRDRRHAAPARRAGHPGPGRGRARLGARRAPDRPARPAARGGRGGDLAGRAGPARRADDLRRNRPAGHRLQRHGPPAPRAALGAPRGADGARGGPRGAPPPLRRAVRPQELHRPHPRLPRERDRHARSRRPRRHAERRRRALLGCPAGAAVRGRPGRRRSSPTRPSWWRVLQARHPVAHGPRRPP